MNKKIYCPKCKTQLYIAKNINWHSLLVYYYPVCTHCGWTTKQVFDSPEEIYDWYKWEYDNGKT